MRTAVATAAQSDLRARGFAASPSGSFAEWQHAIERVLAGRGLSVVAQPIVDLAEGDTTGYEMLSRFDGPLDDPPEIWFAMAESLGYGPALDAHALRHAMAMKPHVPAGCLLFVNVGPQHLDSSAVQAVFRSAGTLSGVVVEFTEHARFGDVSRLREGVAALREAGALVALDDTGAGYAGLQALLALAPDFVKLDRSLVSELDRDPTKRALVEIIGMAAERIGAVPLAEGVERPAELDALLDLGIPLAQGYLFEAPAPGWRRVDGATVRRAHARRAREPKGGPAAVHTRGLPRSLWTS